MQCGSAAKHVRSVRSFICMPGGRHGAFLGLSRSCRRRARGARPSGRRRLTWRRRAARPSAALRSPRRRPPLNGWLPRKSPSTLLRTRCRPCRAVERRRWAAGTGEGSGHPLPALRSAAAPPPPRQPQPAPRRCALPAPGSTPVHTADRRVKRGAKRGESAAGQHACRAAWRALPDMRGAVLCVTAGSVHTAGLDSPAQHGPRMPLPTPPRAARQQPSQRRCPSAPL